MCGNIMVNIKLFNINGNELKINNVKARDCLLKLKNKLKNYF